jgi:predicted ABC-type ATPase
LAPRLWLLAGPNGSGKSTFAQSAIFDRLTGTPEAPAALIRVNPDEAAIALRRAAPDLSDAQLALAAAERSDAEVDGLIARGASFLVETVLSSDKFLPRLSRAREGGFWIGMIFVLLRTPDLNVARVAARAAQGGHDVPEDRIRARWLRSLARLPIFAAQANAYSVWDNSVWGGPPQLLIERVGPSPFVSEGAWTLIEDEETHPALREALRDTLGIS